MSFIEARLRRQYVLLVSSEYTARNKFTRWGIRMDAVTQKPSWLRANRNIILIVRGGGTVVSFFVSYSSP